MKAKLVKELTAIKNTNQVTSKQKLSWENAQRPKYLKMSC